MTISEILGVIQTSCMVLGLFGGVFGYIRYRIQTRRAVLSEYNKRYSEDKNIEIVTRFLITKLEGNCIDEIPGIYEKEMFLRFFEELEYQIQKGRISQRDVQSFFIYYAVAAYVIPEFKLDTELADGGDERIWANYRKLVKRYPELSEEIRFVYEEHSKQTN